MTRSTQFTRRQFVQASTAVAAATIVPRHVLGGTNYVAPSEKINFAIIGCGGQGGGIGRHMGKITDANKRPLSKVTALCDVNMESRHAEGTRKAFPDAPKFQDFREMFEKMGDKIDACSIGVPDHAHFPIAMLAMSKGKHVYVEKPLAHTFEEVQLLMAAEKKYNVSCQMGNQGHSGPNFFQFESWTKAGIIKDVTQVDAFMNSPRRWHPWGYVQGYPQGETPPSTMDWDTWIGTGPMNPYSNRLDPGNWRSWYEYGNGAFGDWGPHILDTIHRFLQLGLPYEIEAVKLEGPNPYIYPMGSTIAFRFGARGSMPPVQITWYDGVRNQPPQPKELPEGKRLPRNGKVIHSKELKFQGGTHGAVLRIIPEAKRKAMADALPKIPNPKTTHHLNFMKACRGEEKTRSSFDVSGPLTQVFLLGVIAQRLGGKLKFDAKTNQITNNDAANALLNPPPRQGWEEFYKL